MSGIINPYITPDLNTIKKMPNKFKEFIEISTNHEIIIKKSDDIYYYQIKTENNPVLHELKWNTLKKNQHKHHLHEYLLEKFGEFRKLMVDSIFFYTVSKIPKCKSTKLKYNSCKAQALGSNSITSDYDINISEDNLIISKQIIETFNKVFFKIFNNSPSEIFDTNIYGISFLNNKHYVITEKNDKESQLGWVFAKLVFLTIKNKCIPDMLNLNPDYTPLGEAQLKKSSISTSNLLKNDYFLNSEKYIEQINKIGHILPGNNFSNLENLELSEQLKIKNLISVSNVFANETYFTQGSFLHVVGELQSKLDLNISKFDYGISAIENFFEILKEYCLYKGEFDSTNFLKHSYKYIFRFYDGLNKALPNDFTKKIKLLSKLDTLRKQKNREKKMKEFQARLDRLWGLDKSSDDQKKMLLTSPLDPSLILRSSRIQKKSPLSNNSSLPSSFGPNPSSIPFLESLDIPRSSRIQVPSNPDSIRTSRMSVNIISFHSPREYIEVLSQEFQKYLPKLVEL